MYTPSSPVDLLLMPVLMTIFGLAIYFGSKQAELNLGTPGKSKWFALVPLALGVYVGGGSLVKLQTDSFYSFALYGVRKLVIAHWLALMIPLAAMILLFVLEKAAQNRRATNPY